jgi:lysophospholipase L1-like esterase
MMKNQYLLLFLAFVFGCSQKNLETTTIYLAGDSTMSIKQDRAHPERGWGMYLQSFFQPEATVENRAMNGRSTKTFIAEGRWASIVQTLKDGDWVLFQFGHNDSSKSKGERYTPPVQYRANLVRFVEETRAKNANPVLCTPIVRRRFNDEGFYDTHGVYPGLVRSVADSLDVPLIDMHQSSMALLKELGPEGTKELFLHIQPGEVPVLPEGLEDNTHFSPMGAEQMAGLFAEELREKQIPLANYLTKP